MAEEDANQFIDVDVRPTKSTYSDEEIWQLLSALSGASNAAQFQALPRPQQKLHLFAAHEEGIGPRTLSRLTGVPYSIVQRATSDTIRYGSMVCESLPGDEDYQTYIDDSEYEKYPEYYHLLRVSGTCPFDPLIETCFPTNSACGPPCPSVSSV